MSIAWSMEAWAWENMYFDDQVVYEMRRCTSRK
jgi:hypothetical protein